MKIAVCRTGSVWWIDTARANPTGEQNDATGVARALRDAGHEVCVFAKANGTIDGCHHIDWDWKALGLDSTNPYPAYDVVLSQIEAWQPDVIVEIAGAAPTMSTVDNHKGVSVFEFAIRYYGMALYTYHKLKLPRIIVLNDPRSYSKDQEMTRWPECIPAAVLSQFAQHKSQVIDGQKYEVKAVYAGCENWWSWDWPYAAIGERHDVNIIAHSHLKDGRLLKNREDVWNWILNGVTFDYKVFGKGWELADSYDPDVHLGPVKPDVVHMILQQTVAGPMIPIMEGWLTAKLRQYLVNGALPLPYGRGQEVALKYDKSCIHVEDDSPIRFSDAGELNVLVERARKDARWRVDMIEKYRDKTKPDFKLLFECVEHFGRGGLQDFERFGGYRLAGD